MDLAPFNHIDPCGYRGLEVTQLADLDSSAIQGEIDMALAHRLAGLLGYNAPVISPMTDSVRLPHG
jgi:lipoyl(octanoyl) transferase